MERNRGRGIFIYVVMILAFLMAYYYISRRDVDVEPAYSYAAFQKDLADGQVEAVEIKPNTQVPTGQITVTLKSKGTEQFFDTDVNAVREMVETKYPAVRVTVRNVPQESLFASTILPVLLMIGALFILMLFMSCGLRVSELVGLNVTDVYEDHLRVLGKGNKERVVFFGDGCREAIDDYLMVRKVEDVAEKDKNALFISQKNCRFGVRGVQQMLDKKLKLAGLDASRYSPHKLRHTAATLMLKNGVDTRALQEVLGHSNLNTTQIYTHLDNAALHEAAMANPIGRKHKSEIEE